MKKFFCLLMLILSIAATVSAADIDKEYNCRVGKLWGFPGERVTFRISDKNMAEIVRRSDGQFCIRPKMPGDFLVEATFQNSDGTVTRQIYLIHAVGENPATLINSNYAEEVLRLVNIERQKNNLQPLTLAKDLSECAMVRANETVKYFSHKRPDGKNFNTVAEKGTYKKIGENINGGAKSAVQVVEAWMNSPKHRENILYPNYNEMGIACVYAANSKYQYYWVQWFRLR